MAFRINALIEQSNQCHEHLRESNRKKDTILGFYISATFIVIGIWGNYYNQGKIELLFWISMLGLVIAGCALGALLTLYRGWHGLYIITSIIFQELIQKSKNTIDTEFIKKIKYRFILVSSAEFITFLFLHAFLIMNLALFIEYTPDFRNSIFENCHTYILYSCIASVIIEFISHFLAMGHLDILKRNGRLNEKYLWMLNGRFSKDKEA